MESTLEHALNVNEWHLNHLLRITEKYEVKQPANLQEYNTIRNLLLFCLSTVLVFLFKTYIVLGTQV